MFNIEKISQAKADFVTKSYCIIDDIIEDKYIHSLYNAVPNLPYQLRTDTVGKFSYNHNVFVASQQKRNHSDINVTKFNYVISEDYSIHKPSYTFNNLVCAVTGFSNIVAKNLNYTYYSHENWLSIHNDAKKHCAYIFYFNKTWEPDWGGQLCITDSTEKRITESIIPYGNRLVLMDVRKNTNNAHFVSPVSINADTPRYSLSGWFYQQEKG